jgi:hypothetical protein
LAVSEGTDILDQIPTKPAEPISVSHHQDIDLFLLNASQDVQEARSFEIQASADLLHELNVRNASSNHVLLQYSPLILEIRALSLG